MTINLLACLCVVGSVFLASLPDAGEGVFFIAFSLIIKGLVLRLGQ